MTPWLTFFIGSLMLTLVMIGGLLLPRHKHPSVDRIKKVTEDDRILYLLLWLASLSIMAYIAFTFGRR